MKRGRSWKNVITVVCVLGVVSASYGVIDYNPAPFRTVPVAGVAPTTYQSWDFSTASDLSADADLNSYGTAVASVGKGDVHHNSYASFQGVWELNDGMSIMVPNNSAANERKEVWIQITFMGAAPVISITPVGGTTTYMDIVSTPVDMLGWTQATYSGVVYPNPRYEDIDIVSSQGPLYVEGMIIETICIPEPVSIALMGLGALLLRRKK